MPAEANGESILFEIEVDLNNNEQVLADISQFSQISEEQEVLFDLDATFQIETVTKQEENRIPYWRVRMTVVKDNALVCLQCSIVRCQLYGSI